MTYVREPNSNKVGPIWTRRLRKPRGHATERNLSTSPPPMVHFTTPGAPPPRGLSLSAAGGSPIAQHHHRHPLSLAASGSCPALRRVRRPAGDQPERTGSARRKPHPEAEPLAHGGERHERDSPPATGTPSHRRRPRRSLPEFEPKPSPRAGGKGDPDRSRVQAPSAPAGAGRPAQSLALAHGAGGRSRLRCRGPLERPGQRHHAGPAGGVRTRSRRRGREGGLERRGRAGRARARAHAPLAGASRPAAAP